MRPTLSDIATKAQVSPATVDRVINDRPNVSERTRTHVLSVARRLGYLPPDETVEVKRVRLSLLLPAGTNAFINDLAHQAIRQAALLPGVAVDIHRIDGLNPEHLADALRAEDADGVAVVALNHPSVRDAIRALNGRRIPVVTLASDIPGAPRLAYIGIDNGQAGRLAGQVMGRFLGRGVSGKVALFAGTLGYRGHQEREMGFRQILSEEFPGLNIVELRESREDRDRAEAEVRALLDRHPDLAGIYNAGGATMGVARALRVAGRDGDMVFVAHEMTPEKRRLILNGTLDAVIDQNARVEIRETLAALSHAARGQAYRAMPPRLQLVLRENLPVE
ncbi:MAG: LacI family DNA-binding transcriptional regulator [Pseudomonadota bacterium]